MLKVQSGFASVCRVRDRIVIVSPTFHLNVCSMSGVPTSRFRVRRMASRTCLSTFAPTMRRNRPGSVAITTRSYSAVRLSSSMKYARGATFFTPGYFGSWSWPRWAWGHPPRTRVPVMRKFRFSRRRSPGRSRHSRPGAGLTRHERDDYAAGGKKRANRPSPRIPAHTSGKNFMPLQYNRFQIWSMATSRR